jgi:hypothetical protein
VRTALVAVLVAGTARADPEPAKWPQDTRLQVHDTDPPDDPPMPVFASPTAFTLLRLAADGSPRCETWTTQRGSDANHGHLVHDALTVDYHSAGIRLDVCDYHALVHEEASGNELDIDGTRWFRDPRGCADALAKHRKVATDFHSCTTPPLSAKVVEAARAQFHAAFGHAGNLWVRDDGACRVARVGYVKDREHPGQVVIDYPDRTRTVFYAYEVDNDVLDLDGEETAWKKTGEGESWGVGDAGAQTPELGDGTITVFSTTFFTTEAGCRAVIAADQRRATWLPTPP